MPIPILIDGSAAGWLRESSAGLYTLFEAALPPRPGLTRLYVTDGTVSACLGLMEPGEEALTLRRRCTRLERARLPQTIQYATIEPPSPQNLKLKTQNADTTWHAHRDGSLTAQIGPQRLLALPVALRRPAPAARQITVNDRQYWLFRY